MFEIRALGPLASTSILTPPGHVHRDPIQMRRNSREAFPVAPSPTPTIHLAVLQMETCVLLPSRPEEHAEGFSCSRNKKPASHYFVQESLTLQFEKRHGLLSGFVANEASFAKIGFPLSPGDQGFNGPRKENPASPSPSLVKSPSYVSTTAIRRGCRGGICQARKLAVV